MRNLSILLRDQWHSHIFEGLFDVDKNATAVEDDYILSATYEAFGLTPDYYQMSIKDNSIHINVDTNKSLRAKLFTIECDANKLNDYFSENKTTVIFDFPSDIDIISSGNCTLNNINIRHNIKAFDNKIGMSGPKRPKGCIFIGEGSNTTTLNNCILGGLDEISYKSYITHVGIYGQNTININDSNIYANNLSIKAGNTLDTFSRQIKNINIKNIGLSDHTKRLKIVWANIALPRATQKNIEGMFPSDKEIYKQKLNINITELAKATGLPIDIFKHYNRINLISPTNFQEAAEKNTGYSYDVEIGGNMCKIIPKTSFIC